MKKISLTLMFLLLNTLNIYASNYDTYIYTSSKQDNGLTYELVKVDLTTTSLYLEGWAYIPDTQHYKNTSDITTTIMVYESGGEEMYFPTTITSKYNLTEVEKFANVSYCGDNVYNQDPSKCAYYYNYVGFNVTIPLSNFTYPNTYEFYIYVKSNDSNIKRYTKLYSPNVEDSITIGNFTYSFVSDVEDTEMIINDPNVFVRTTPEKTSDNIYVKNGCSYYWDENEHYSSSSKTYVAPLTWYQLNFYPSTTSGYNGCIADPGTTNKGYIASNFVDFAGYGNSKLTITTKADVMINKVAIPTINTSNDVVVYAEIKATGLNEAITLDVVLTYGSYTESKTITVDNNEIIELEFTIPKEYINSQNIVSVAINLDDIDDTNNVVNIEPSYATESEDIVDITNSSDRSVTLNAISGVEYYNEEVVYYNEVVTLYINGAIEQVPEEFYNQNGGFEHFYAGGAFSYDINYEYSNTYPYNYNDTNNTKATLTIDSSYTDNPKEVINYILDDDTYVLEPVYITSDNVISYTPSSSDLYPEGQNVIYTSFTLENGKYEFSVNIDDVGINERDIIINSYFEVSGVLFSQSSDALLYYKTMSPIITESNGESKIWQDYNTDTLFDEGSKTIEIYLSETAKQEIKSWIEQDYENNITGNDEVFKNLVDSLITTGDIIISEVV